MREEQAGTLPADRGRRARHEPDGLPEGRVLEPLPLLAGPRDASAEARGRARRGQVRARLLGRGARPTSPTRILDAIQEQGPESIINLLHARARRGAGAHVLARRSARR